MPDAFWLGMLGGIVLIWAALVAGRLSTRRRDGPE